jgi:phage replication O-like protein O
MEPYTKVPNVFLENMYKATVPANLVFMAICRKTLGWSKEWDVISYGQIHKMTGLSVNAIRRAIEVLLKLKWIEKRNIGKQKHEYKITISPEAIATNDTELYPQEIQLGKKLYPQEITQKKKNKEKRKSVKKHTDPRVKPLTDFFFELYNDKMGNGQKPAWGGAEGKLLKTDIQRIKDTEKIRIAMKGFFSDQIENVKNFTDKSGYTYRAFHGCLDGILNELRRIEDAKNKRTVR